MVTALQASSTVVEWCVQGSRCHLTLGTLLKGIGDDGPLGGKTLICLWNVKQSFVVLSACPCQKSNEYAMGPSGLASRFAASGNLRKKTPTAVVSTLEQYGYP